MYTIIIKMIEVFICIICVISFVECKFEPFVVGGDFVDISQFPHSVLLRVTCTENKNAGLAWTCGGSIVNQLIILTAAHCLSQCEKHKYVSVQVGHSRKGRGFMSSIQKYNTHEKFGTTRKKWCDIALAKLKTKIRLGANVKRVILMQDPPYNEKAQIAGWGAEKSVKKKSSIDRLQAVDQYVRNHTFCKKYIKKMPPGAFCASSDNTDEYSTTGDSGSALVVRGFIQIGIVSYGIPTINKSLVVYTDTGYFYDWIRNKTKTVYCA